MKILLFKNSIAMFCLLLTEVCSSENFLIVRGTSKDFFSIPPTNCDKDNDAFDYCSEYNATTVRGQRCECVCNDKEATFSFHKQSWSCLKNEDTRTLFGCSQPTLFDKEKQDDKLNVLKSGGENRVDLTSSNCEINTISSWYIDCDGKKVTVVSTGISMENTFEIEQDSRAYDFEVVRLPTTSPLAGRIINLGITCSSQTQPTNQNYCLLFKLRGTTSCPVTVTQTTTTKTTTMVETVLKSAPPEVSLGTNPTQGFTPPNSAADQSIADEGSTFSLGAIVGVAIGAILIVLLVGHFIYRRHSARKNTRTISEGQSSQSDSESQPRDQNEGYETLSTYRAAIYTSNYDVPYGGSEDERAHLRSPRAPSASEGHDNKGLNGEEPFYSTVDELYSDCNGKHGEYVDPASSERSRDIGPLSVEQRVYNIMEVLNTSTSNSPDDYSSNVGNQDQVPPSVEQRRSNAIEVLNTDPSESSYEYVDPASSERSRDIGPLSVEQRVYNMMEDLNINTSDSSYDYGSKEGNQDRVRLSVEPRISNVAGVLNTDISESPYEYVDPASSEKSREIGPLSVEQRVYNMIEVFDTVIEEDPNSSDPRQKETPVYNVLEGPLQKGSSDIDPVYNVLERPDSEKTEKTSYDTLYNTKQQENNSNTFLYAVA